LKKYPFKKIVELTRKGGSFMTTNESHLIERYSLSNAYEYRRIEKGVSFQAASLSEPPFMTRSLKAVYPHFVPKTKSEITSFWSPQAPSALTMKEATKAYQTMKKMQKQLHRAYEELQSLKLNT
jgi:hypothetical protein